MRVQLKKTIRDIRDIKLQFLALITILSLGAGMFYGMNLMTSWREDSVDLTYETLRWEDIQVDLLANTYVNSSIISNVIFSNDYFSDIESFELRLMLTIAVNVSTGNQFLIVPGKVIATNVTYSRASSGTNRPDVNDINIESGRYFETSESEQLITIADKRLFKYNELFLGDTLTLLGPIGSIKVELIGSATFPDYLMLIDENAMGLFSEKQYTVLQMPLKSIQKAFVLENKINQVLLRVKDESKIYEVKTSLENSLQELGIASITKLGTDNPIYTYQYEDLQNDNEFFQIIALLFLVGGLFGTYVTISRLTTSQRREIGISLALGFKSRGIVYQYLLLGLIISVLSSIITFVVGSIIANAFWDMIKEMLGLPFYITSSNHVYFIQACLLITLIPFLTILLSVGLLSRKVPVELIRFDPKTTHSTSSKTLLEKTVFRFLNISISKKISLRNIFRNKRRTFSTATGVLISIILMGAMWGLLDTFDSGIQTAQENIGTWDLKFESNALNPELLWQNNLDSIPSNNSIKSFILTFQTTLRFPGYYESDGSDCYRLLEGMLSLGSIRGVNLIEGSFVEQELVISKKTSQFLNKQVGDYVTVEHIVIGGQFDIQLKNTTLKISGIHDQIFASFCYIPLETVQSMSNTSNLVNGGYIALNEHSSEQSVIEDLYQNVFAINRITSRNSLIEETETIFDMFYDVLIVAQGLCMILALGLIYNSVFSNIHERKREIGTLRTLGTSPLAIIRYIFIENAIMVSIGLFLGYLLGYLLIDLILQGILTETFPHLYVPTVLAFNSWIVMVLSIFLILLVAHGTVISFLKNLDLVGATKVRE